MRIEPPSVALERYGRIAEELARTATELMACKGSRCEPIVWPDSTELLAVAGLTVVLHESGLREDIQFGRPPLGRGSIGEACLMQIDVRQGPRYATWLSPEAREQVGEDRAERERFARTLLGDEPAALGHCFEIGLRMLARARESCSKSKSWAHGMFSMYGTGATCNAGSLRNREATFEALQRLARRYKLELEKASSQAPTQNS